MIVRQDDTVVCEGCYELGDESSDGAILPAHREVFSFDVRTPEPCDCCGESEA